MSGLPVGVELIKTIVASANDAGGDVYLGVRVKPREVIGLGEGNIWVR